MRITSLQGYYNQKSRLFLYPLLGIKKGSSVTPIETYMSWANVYSTKDCRLICNYHKRKDQEFKIFEEKFLIGNTNYENHYELEDGSYAYIFDFTEFKTDYQKVVTGRYSQLSFEHKQKVADFVKSHRIHHARILSYLDPSSFYEDYAELYATSVERLKRVGELCNPPDLTKENLGVLKKNINFEPVLKITNTL